MPHTVTCPSHRSAVHFGQDLTVGGAVLPAAWVWSSTRPAFLLSDVDGLLGTLGNRYVRR
jgi:hypothetical protein